MNIEESSTEVPEEMDTEKRANWVERLLEQRSRRNIQQHQEVEEGRDDGDSDGDGNGNEGGCEVDYSEGGIETHDRDSFSRLLDRVFWYDTKLFSQHAILCNMAYVIPMIKVCDRPGDPLSNYNSSYFCKLTGEGFEVNHRTYA